MKSYQSFRILRFSEIPSTQLYIRDQIKAGITPPDLVIADSQSNGQGRQGKSFYSPKNTGLYFSFCIPVADLPEQGVTPRVALAVRDAIHALWGISTSVKWVNDLYYGKGKCCGILTQLFEPFAVIGIGVNLVKPVYLPVDLSGRVSWLFEQKPDNALVLPEYVYRALSAVFSEDTNSVLRQYQKFCCHVGREVKIHYDHKIITGVCTGIDDNFCLILETKEGAKSFDSGFVSLEL